VHRVIYKSRSKKDACLALITEHFNEHPNDEIATISITKGKPKRSEMQSNLYFRWRDITEMHNEFKNAFLEGRSTKELTMEQFVVFLLEIEVFSDDLGIKLPRSSDYKSAIYGN